MNMRYANAVVVGLAILVVACATVQQVAIKADMAYSTAVFALDDAEWAACHPAPVAPLTADLCAPLDVKVGQALLDVKATTNAIQSFPVTVPTTLAALLQDLNSVQISLIGLEQTPLIMSIAAKTADANAKAIALITKLQGK